MDKRVPIKRLNHTDLNMYQCGSEDCEPGHDYGPAVRDHFLIHYIKNGKGTFYTDGRKYHLGGDQGFLILPGVVTYYQADYEDPWSYSWVGFHGLKAELYLKHAGLTAENPVFTYNRDSFIHDCFDQMIATKSFVKGREIRLLGHLYLFLSQLIEVNGKDRFIDSGTDRKELYVRKTLEFIDMNYSRKTSVAEIARYIGLDRSYLGSVFKEHMGMSLQDYMVAYRINKACELMENSSLSIGDISRSVGYDDPLLFSKMFKKVKKLPPREYRIHFRSRNRISHDGCS